MGFPRGRVNSQPGPQDSHLCRFCAGGVTSWDAVGCVRFMVGGSLRPDPEEIGGPWAFPRRRGATRLDIAPKLGVAVFLRIAHS